MSKDQKLRNKIGVSNIKKLFISGSRWLDKHAEVLNDLNVYPVPDGDTGTNMSMTLQSAENNIIKLPENISMKELCDVISEAVLLGARGNSGTILSQIIQGSLAILQDYEELDVEILKKALENGKEKAYKAVSDPVEGTMLTVIRKISESANEYEGVDLLEFLSIIKKAAEDAVEETPNLLYKLKEAGVVDAGGKGIFYILEGFEKSITDPEILKDIRKKVEHKNHNQKKMEYISNEDIKYSYCTEFIIESGDFDLEEYKEKISHLGDSMVCAQTSKKTKTHIHTNNPGQILEIAGSLGPLNNIKIENMKTQHEHLLFENSDIVKSNVEEKFIYEPLNRVGSVIYAIADNKEMAELFIKSGATAVLIGGQTNNPSVADIEKGLSMIDAETIYLLPNNKNIISSARIAADRDSRNIIVLETTSMLEGHYFIRSRHFNLENVLKQRTYNYSIEITQAVRNTTSEGLEIKSGDYIALINGKIRYSDTSLYSIIKRVMGEIVDENTLRIISARGKNGDIKVDEFLNGLECREFNQFETNQENYPYYIYVEKRSPDQPRTAIVTDSSSDLELSLVEDLPISIVPLKINFGNKTFKDGINISKKEFWQKLIKEKVVPKTAQPSPTDFKNVYLELFKRGYDNIVSIHISSKLSGTYQAAKIAREMTGKESNIEIIDSKSVSFGLAHRVIEAAKMSKENISFEEIIENTKSIEELKFLFAVEDLTYLQKGGRISKFSSTIGGILKMKPIITIEDGSLSLAAKTFGDSGPLSYMQKVIKNEGKKSSCILYTGWGGTTKELINSDTLRKTANQYRKIEFREKIEIGATIGSHSGPVYGMLLISKIR